MSGRESEKKPENVAHGLKSAMHNEMASEEAKFTAARRLQGMSKDVPGMKEPGLGSTASHVMGGYKSTLKNPKVSEEAKHHAEEVLKDAYD
ncbi:hypothetical protein CPB84DRAFT_1857557 [Gymnopilus junonius]|uniref:Conidiation-specific protein 6 n=1 Tax=Gymnopilus junonius TaxID=109634 RepID=A0A9P5N746_GYMJU|nr:hypothetical protein CPB84DRAFT_1857557 [Gymnopilus junonius]